MSAYPPTSLGDTLTFLQNQISILQDRVRTLEDFKKAFDSTVPKPCCDPGFYQPKEFVSPSGHTLREILT